MTKSIVAIATAVLAATTLLSSAAEAGFRVGIGFGGGVPPYLTDYNKQSASEHKAAKKRYRAARRHQEKAPVRAAKKKPAASTSVAKIEKVETETAPVKTAETENSSISVAQTDIAQTTTVEPVQTAAIPSEPEAREIGCKKFFPSAGLTLTVPCE